MRKAILFGIVFVGFVSLASARQRPAMPPAAMPPAARPMPSGPGPATGGRVAPMHSAPSAGHPVTHPIASSGMKPTLSRRSTTRSGITTGVQPHRTWNAGRTIRDNFCSGQPFNQSFGNPVPGFGFDYEHFYAVHPNWNACHQVSGAVLPFWGGGFYMPVPYYSENVAQEGAQESASNEQADSGHQYVAQDATSNSSSSRQSSYNYSPAEPVAEFVFVKRDGSTFNAVAYTLLKDKIRYVTKDGLRRTVPLDSLDLEATEKTNEERGTTIEFPGVSHA